mgnify:CR=1 FL=1
MAIPPWVETLRKVCGQKVAGQQAVVDMLILALACRGHVLLEGVPGLAKTRLASAFANALGLGFQRISFTSDMLPGDILGGPVYHPGTGEFRVRKGPIFHQVILADEFNRAPPRTHSALLEAMQERQVTLGDDTLPLGNPFLVIATQNPIETEGVYPLPEAELDRFLFRVVMKYPSRDEEVEILGVHAFVEVSTEREVPLDPAIWEGLPRLVDGIHASAAIRGYIVDLIRATRCPETVPGLKHYEGLIRLGASPRAGVMLLQGARAHALIRGGDHVIPSDVQAILGEVLGHRILFDWRAGERGLSVSGFLNELAASVGVVG